ncbi:MAG: heavy-metal-associated domain-containing protein [Bacteroidota bacterium]
MKTEEITVANLKCNGCASTIKKELLKVEGIKTVEVAIEKDTITLSHENVSRAIIINKLHSLGYPEATEKNGLLLQLKSYTSCMIGKINNI